MRSATVMISSSSQSLPSPLQGGEGMSSPLVMWRLQLHNHRGYTVLHFGERHGIDDLVVDAIIILTTEVRLAPEIIKLHGLHGLGDLFGIETLGFLHGCDKGKSRIGKIDTGGIP